MADAEDHEDSKAVVLLCRCEGEISTVIDLDRVRKRALAHPSVKSVSVHDSLCSEEGRSSIQQLCQEHDPGCVVMVACPPEAIETPLKMELEKAGLNACLAEQVDIREQCAWVHPSKTHATMKASSLVRGAVDRCLKQKTIEDLSFAVTGAALIVGGTEEGIRAAKEIANAGFEVYLVDESSACPGSLAAVHHDSRVLEENGRVKILSESRIESIDGVLGKRHVKVHTAEGAMEFDVGTILIATRRKPNDISRTPHADQPGLMTIAEFEDHISEWEQELRLGRPLVEGPPSRIGFVQWISDDVIEEKAVHVQSAFTALAIAQALRFKKLNPSAEIDFYLHDAEGFLRTSKALSDSAIRAGIRFHSLQSPAETIVETNRIIVRAVHSGELEHADVESDLVVIVGDRTRSGMTPTILNMLHLGTGEGRTASDPLGWREWDYSRGVFVIRVPSSAEGAEEAIAEAGSAASVMIDMMRQRSVRIPRQIAQVQEHRCRGCGKCANICEHDAIKLAQRDGGVQIAQVDEMRCEGCGLCRVACCNGAMALLGYTTTQMLAQMLGMIEEASA